MPQRETIIHHYAVKGQERTLCELRDVVAVCVQDESRRAILHFGFYGTVMAPEDVFPGTPARAPDFETNAAKMAKAGWHFMAADKPQRAALSRDGYAPARVMLSPAGDALLDAGGVTVRLKPELSAVACAEMLAEKGLTVSRVLRFAPNLYLAHTRTGESGVAAVAALARDARVLWAEPDLIEAWRHVPQRGLQAPRSLPGPNLG